MKNLGLAVPGAVGGESLIQNSSGHAVDGEQEGREMTVAKASGDIFCLSLGMSKFRAWAILLGWEEATDHSKCCLPLIVSFIDSLPSE